LIWNRNVYEPGAEPNVAVPIVLGEDASSGMLNSLAGPPPWSRVKASSPVSELATKGVPLKPTAPLAVVFTLMLLGALPEKKAQYLISPGTPEEGL
jgi:hypothetical protein